MFLFCKHIAHKDGLRKPRTFIREGRREAPKKDAGRLDSSPQRLNSLPDVTVCSSCVLVNTQLNQTIGERVSFSAIWSSSRPSLIPLSFTLTSAEGKEIKATINSHPHSTIQLGCKKWKENRVEFLLGQSRRWKFGQCIYISNMCHTFHKWVWKWELVFQTYSG